MRLFFQKDEHKETILNIRPWFYLKPTVYQFPFLSIRWLCFELLHEPNNIGDMSGGGIKIK